MTWVLALALCAFAAQDSLKLLEEDGSSVATKKIAEIYKHTKSKDQRFWLIQALGVRLKERKDSTALEMLLNFSADSDPEIRGTALRAMAGFSSLPEETISGAWLARMDAAAAVGVRDRAGSVRDGAADLKRLLELWRVSPHQQGLPSSSSPPQPALLRLARIFRWLWVLSLPALALAWALAGLPVFDPLSASGRLARLMWPVLRGEKLVASISVLLWLGLAMFTATGLFDAFARFVGRPLYPGVSWVRTYFLAGFCFFAPGAVLAARFSCAQTIRGLLRQITEGAVVSLVVFGILIPLEIAYRLFFRKGGRKGGSRGEAFQTLRWILDTGALRAGYLACALMAREGHGLLPAWRRAAKLFSGRRRSSLAMGLGVYDVRFPLALAPALAFLGVFAARGLPVDWEISGLVVMLGCALWTWSVLAVLLMAVVQAMEGMGAAACVAFALDRRLPPKLPHAVLEAL